jgi:hypothetical protein
MQPQSNRGDTGREERQRQKERDKETGAETDRGKQRERERQTYTQRETGSGKEGGRQKSQKERETRGREGERAIRRCYILRHKSHDEVHSGWLWYLLSHRIPFHSSGNQNTLIPVTV